MSGCSIAPRSTGHYARLSPARGAAGTALAERLIFLHATYISILYHRHDTRHWFYWLVDAAFRPRDHIQYETMDHGAGSGLNGLFKIGQTVYALVAVTQQTHDLLDSANHVSLSVETVRSLRRQKSGLLQAEEKRWIDRVIHDTEKTLNNVASLVEPARVDMQTKLGKIGLVNRALFVFRDSPKVATNLARLTLTNQSLNTALTMLSSREGTHPKATRVYQDSGSSPSEPNTQIQEATKPPPSY